VACSTSKTGTAITQMRSAAAAPKTPVSRRTAVDDTGYHSNRGMIAD
jgi:hypothetical protein